MQGGAYGGSSGFDPFSGTFAFTSYRDPNLLDTLDVYDGAAKFLEAGVGEQDLVRSVIGVIGSVDTYRLPDAKGFTSLLWELTGDTEEDRQQRRDEILGGLQPRLQGAGRRPRAGRAAGPGGGAGLGNRDQGGQRRARQLPQGDEGARR